MRLGRLLSFLPVLALCACGETKRESACSVFDNGDGTRTIVCGEESIVVPGQGDGTSCVKSPSPDGGAVIACTDGTTIFLDPAGNVIHRGAGAVVGRVTLFGETDHAGTLVRAAGTERAAFTDEKGDFFLDGLDAGVYDLLVERDGWEPLRHRNTIAVGGVLYLDPLVLRRGRPLGGPDATTWVSPAGDTVLVRDGRSLWLHRVDRIAPIELSPHVPLGPRAGEDDEELAGDADTPAYDPEGKAVVFLEYVDPASGWGRLRRHDVASGETTTLAERALLGIPLAGGTTLVWRVPADVEPGEDVTSGEVVLRYPDGGELALGPAPIDRAAFTIAPGGVAVATRVQPPLIADVAARQTFVPTAGAYVAAWAPDGRRAVLAAPVTPDGASPAVLHLLDLDSRTTVDVPSLAYAPPAGENRGAVAFSADGARILFLDESTGLGAGGTFLGQLRVVDTTTLELHSSPETDRELVAWRFSPDGAVIYQRSAGTLVHWNLRAGRFTPLGVVAVDDVLWSPRGDRYAFSASESCTLGAIDEDGNPSFLPPFSGRCMRIAFLPDGERAAVVIWNENAQPELRRWSGGEPEPIRELPNARPETIRFAPDGSAILWVTDVAMDPGVQQTVTVRSLVDEDEASLALASGYEARFSADGAHVVAATTAEHELWVLERASGAAFAIDAPLDGSPDVGHPGFVLYRVDDDDGGRTGPWLSRYPRAPAE